MVIAAERHPVAQTDASYASVYSPEHSRRWMKGEIGEHSFG
jgi:hypothetical protein